ncbi:MAG: HAD-IA family hydrolase [Paracoccaceae bacterium]
MSAPLRLVIFDVDGTLVDSQGTIVACMATAFQGCDLPAPSREAVLSIVGLSLDHAMRRLAPEQPDDRIGALVAAYKSAFAAFRMSNTDYAPLYPGALEAVQGLAEQADLLLGIATGKSRRGLSALLETHNLTRHFITRQTADDHPSKPHPSMIYTAMAEAGVEPVHTVMIGDTTFDMDMARAAGVTGIGVNWGYHPADRLGADHMLEDFADLPALLQHIWKG